MSCYIPVLEKLKLLKTNACSSNSSSSDIKSNVSKSKSSNNNASAARLAYPSTQGFQQEVQDASHRHVEPWEFPSMKNHCTSNNGASSNAKINQNNYYINGGLDVSQGNRPQTNHVSSSVQLQQHHFSVPSSLTVPSPPPSYHSNNQFGQTNIVSQSLSNKKIIACSPPPPYDSSKTNVNPALDQSLNQNLHVLPLPSNSAGNNSLLTYQNDINVQHQNLPPRPPKHDNKRSQLRRRDQNGVTIVQQIGTFPNNVPLNIRHNHPTLGLSDVAYQRQHSDHGRYRNSSPIVSHNSSQFNTQNNQRVQEHGSGQLSAQKGVLTLGLPSHWKKLPFKKAGCEENGKPITGQNHFSVLDSVNKGEPSFSDNTNGFNIKLPYQTAPSNFIHHTYETLNKPLVYQPSIQNVLDVDRSRTYKNVSKQSARNSSLPRRLRKSKTPTPGTNKSQRYRPRSAQDHMIAGLENMEPENAQAMERVTNRYPNNNGGLDHDMIQMSTYDVTRIEAAEINNILKSGSDQDDDEGIGEGDISTGSKSGGRNTTSSSGASSGGSRSPDDDDDSSRQLVRCVESSINHVKSANRRYLPTMPSPSQGPPPRHLLPSKLKPSPAFKMHPIPLLHEQPTHNHAFRKPGHQHLQLQHPQMDKTDLNNKNSSRKYQDHPHNGNNTETLRIQGKAYSLCAKSIPLIVLFFILIELDNNKLFLSKNKNRINILVKTCRLKT